MINVDDYLQSVGEASAVRISAETGHTLAFVYGQLAKLEAQGKARVYATDRGKTKVRTWGWVDGIDIDAVHK